MNAFGQLRLGIAPAVCLAILTAAPTRAEDRQLAVPDLKVEKYTLPNGLDVILLEDHTAPVVAVNIWYKVGSKNETLGHTGSAHLIEHLMFDGSEHHNSSFFAALGQLGANVGATTTLDRTNYFETLPAHGLELALWLESDRMGYLLPVLTQAKVKHTVDVVKNERRLRIDDVPYVRTSADVFDNSPSRDNHNVSGSMADLSAASASDLAAFYRAFYSPNNASLAIVGDFHTPETKRLVAQYFGPLGAGPAVRKLKPNRLISNGSKYVSRSEHVSHPQTRLSWTTVEIGHPDQPALAILAHVLGWLPRENRLYRTLVADKKVAIDVQASSVNTEVEGSFVVRITARPGQSLDALITMAQREIERLKQTGPTEVEVEKARIAFDVQLISDLQSVGRLADFLNSNNVLFGNPTAYTDRRKRLLAVTPADVTAVARRHLTGGRMRFDITPGPVAPRATELAADRLKVRPYLQSTRPADPNAAEWISDGNHERHPGAAAQPHATNSGLDRNKGPNIGPTPKFTPPPFVRRTLSNGLELLIAERHQMPMLTLRLFCRGGENVAPRGKEGLAALAAHVIPEATESRDYMKLAGELSKLGATGYTTLANVEWSGLELVSPKSHEAKAIELFADVLVHPAFSELDLERLRAQRVAAILRRSDSAGGIANDVFGKLLYGSSHPYGRVATLSSVQALSREDLVNFYKQVLLPNNSAMIIVGDTTADAITAKLETALEGWRPAEPPHPQYSEIRAPKALSVYLIDMPGAAQSLLVVGQARSRRHKADSFALRVLNIVLGELASSRLGLNLREDKGYSYVAHSTFSFAHGTVRMTAGAAVETAVTADALVEILKELKELTSSRPVTDQELAFAKGYLINHFPLRFETARGIAGVLTEVAANHLADDYFATYQSKIASVSKEDVIRVAKEYVDFEHLTILVVGDRKKIEPKLKERLNAPAINVLTTEGDPLTNDRRG
jgi:zinc protease